MQHRVLQSELLEANGTALARHSEHMQQQYIAEEQLHAAQQVSAHTCTLRFLEHSSAVRSFFTASSSCASSSPTK
jgi:hypothetical protein